MGFPNHQSGERPVATIVPLALSAARLSTRYQLVSVTVGSTGKTEQMWIPDQLVRWPEPTAIANWSEQSKADRFEGLQRCSCPKELSHLTVFQVAPNTAASGESGGVGGDEHKVADPSDADKSAARDTLPLDTSIFTHEWYDEGGFSSAGALPLRGARPLTPSASESNSNGGPGTDV